MPDSSLEHAARIYVSNGWYIFGAEELRAWRAKGWNVDAPPTPLPSKRGVHLSFMVVEDVVVAAVAGTSSSNRENSDDLDGTPPAFAATHGGRLGIVGGTAEALPKPDHHAGPQVTCPGCQKMIVKAGIAKHRKWHCKRGSGFVPRQGRPPKIVCVTDRVPNAFKT